jgi:hypothetical protein
MDLARVDLSRYKLLIFGNTFALDDAQRAHIKEHVMKDGRSVVFMSGAGYTDCRKNDVAFISDLVHMRIEKMTELDSRVTATLNGRTAELDVKGVVSRFKIADGDVRAIGTYSSGPTAAAVKNVGGSKVYYFGVPLKAPLEFFKALLGEARIRTCVENTVERDYVAVGGGIIGIYAVSGGEKIIKPLNGTAHKMSMPPFSTLYFDLQTGAPLNSRLLILHLLHPGRLPVEL